MLKVLIIAAGIPVRETPLAGIFAFDQAKALQYRGVDVRFFVVDMRSVRHNKRVGIRCFEHEGVRCGVISLPTGRLPVGLGNYIGSRLIWKLYKKIGFRPDIVHAHFGEVGDMAAFLSEKERLPLVVTEHSSAVNKDKPRQRDLKNISVAAHSADALISVSKALAEKIYKHTEIYPMIIHNIVDSSLFYVKRIEHDTFNIVNVGNLISIKGQRMLIDAFELFHRKYPLSNLYIIGDGELKNDLVRQIKAKNLTENIKLVGRLKRADINNVFHKCDVFAFSSKSETFGVSCIEALASGLPVVSTNCGGPSDFVDDSNGIVVEDFSAEAFFHGLDYIYKNYSKFDCHLISDKTKEKFSPEKISGELMKIYSKLI